MSVEQEIRDSVDAVKAPGTFNIVNVLKDRGYPETTVSVILNEQIAYKAASVRERLEEIKDDKSESAKKERLELEQTIDSLRAELSASAYTVHLTGIPEGKREEIYREARKKYPVEYEAPNQMQSILGNAQRVEKDSPERDALFTDFLWQAHIKKIVDPEGNEQTEFTYNTIKSMREGFPISATMKINEAVEKLRTATAVFIMETGEDFLAKP